MNSVLPLDRGEEKKEERLLNIGGERRQAEDLRNATWADVVDCGEVLRVAYFAGS